MMRIAGLTAARRVAMAMAVATDASGQGEGTTAAPAPELVDRDVVSTAAPEFATTLTADGRELYFDRASADRAKLTIMTAQRDASGAWSAPVAAPFSGTYRDVDPFVAPDGRRLYFSSDRPRAIPPPATSSYRPLVTARSS